jgi:hypothetical protein
MRKEIGAAGPQRGSPARTRLRRVAATAAMSLVASVAAATGVLGPVTAASAAAGDYTVNTKVDTPWAPGVCPNRVRNACSLRAAVTQANMDGGGSTVHVPAGRYTLTRTDNGGLTDIPITAGMVIIGANARTTTIDGNGTWRIFTVGQTNGQTVQLSALTLTNGGQSLINRQGLGGAVLINGTSAVVRMQQVIVKNNHVTGFGGGINNHGSLTLLQVELNGNSSGRDGQGDGVFEGSGGGIYNTGRLVVQYSTVDGNDALRGGGIVNSGGSTFVTNATVSGNTARGPGGGIWTVGGLLHTKWSTVTNNFSRSTPAPDSCFPLPATVPTSGPCGCPPGGACPRPPENTNSPACNCQSKDFPNRGLDNGGGLVSLSGGDVKFGGTILAANHSFSGTRSSDCYTTDAPVGDNPIVSARNNLIGVLSPVCHISDEIEGTNPDGTTNYDGEGSVDDPWDPMLSPLATGSLPDEFAPTHALVLGSDAIDGANGQTQFGVPAANPITPDPEFGCIANDERGAHRPIDQYGFGPICDIGAYELQ